MKQKWLIGVGLVLVVGVLVWANLRQVQPDAAASGAPRNAPKSAPIVKVAPVGRQDINQTVLAPGYLDTSDLTEVRAPFGTLKAHLLVGLGDQVTQGQSLVELNSADLALQVVGEEAQLARAETALAQLEQQRLLAPLQLAQRIESAKAQLIQAQASLAVTQRQTASAQQQLQQAQAGLVAAEARLTAGNTSLSDLRQQLQVAEAQYRADPLNSQTREAYVAAEQAYADVLRQADETARQMVADLVQAQQAVAVTRQELDAATSSESASGEPAAATQVAGTDDNAGATAGQPPLAIRQAQAAVDAAQAALAAVQQEADAGSLLDQQVRSAIADVAAAGANLENTRQKLAQAQIKAPFDGRILSLGIRDGEPVQTGLLLMEIGKLDRMTVQASVDEMDIGKVKIGQKVTIKTNAYPDAQFEGLVVRTAVQAGTDPRAGGGPGTNYQIEGEVPNPDGKLLGGMNAEVTILTDSLQNVLAVGLEAIREEDGQTSVLVLNGFTVEVRPVTLGLRTQTVVQVLDGLAEGEEVVISPFTLVRSLNDGDPVRPEPVEVSPATEVSQP